MKIAVCIGHSRSGDDGAVSVSGVSEWAFWQPLGKRIVDRLKAAGVDAMLVDDYVGADYGEAMGWLAGQLRVAQVDAAIELHFNSADNRAASGHEWLYFEGSQRGHALALALERRYALTFQDARRRGVLPRKRADRGALFLQRTHCPSVICEPFFGSNAKEWAAARRNDSHIIATLAAGVLDWVKAEVGAV
jgi:N-acetylmuramoyl-L-alanine amidase